MVIIDNTTPKAVDCITFAENVEQESGYAIHYDSESQHFELYTDDGRGNGNFICETADKQMMLRIAYLLKYEDEANMRDIRIRQNHGRNAFNRLS